MLVLTAAAAAGITLFHGAIMRRMTFFLFRLYVTAVAFGVGLLAATPSSFTVVSLLHVGRVALFVTSLLLIPTLATLLAWFACSYAEDFRGARPDRLNPVGPEEYSPSGA